MALYAISDLHLALSTDKPMDIFGGHWVNHDEKIKKNWENKITEEDTVLIAGDISWSMKHEDSKMDLDWVNSLPGKKIIRKGNNDYAICGTIGWLDPSSDKFNSKDAKIYAREQIRLRLSLDEAKKQGFDKFIVMIHYPPFGEENKESELMKIFKEYNVEKVIYGHLHGPSNVKAIEGVINGIEYIMTSCDFINFDPIKILED